MPKPERRLFKFTDFIIIGIVLSVAFSFLIWGRQENGQPTAVITVNGNTSQRINLNTAEDKIFTVDTSPVVTIQIKDSKIRFTDSLCPDKTCEKCGFLYEIGDTAACVPAGVVITIDGDGLNSDLDAVAG
ncbi:MAG: NusG domain II-containing protein [Clostridia bacterium]|nr:NusG domain II-containing protein [Clostridia bacterium]